jgi:hypothetical protein
MMAHSSGRERSVLSNGILIVSKGNRYSPHWLLALLSLVGAGCGSGGSDGPGSPVNRAPTANAGTSVTVVEQTVVVLQGTGADADGNPLSYEWTQTAGPAVTLSNANTAQASFTAPDVAPGAPEVLTFRLTVSDPSGLSGTSIVNITVTEPAAAVTISGSLNYEFPPPNTVPAICDGLNFNAVETVSEGRYFIYRKEET